MTKGFVIELLLLLFWFEVWKTIDKQEKSYQPFLYGFSKLFRIIQSLLYIEKQISKS